VGAAIQRGLTRLHAMVQRTMQAIAQPEQRLAGVLSIPDRLVSVFDPEVRPIRRGKLSAKTEFGYKALLTETEERLITHYEVHMGNPGDGGLLPAAFQRHVEVVGRAPRAVAADRAFGSKPNEDFLRTHGVQRISLPYADVSVPRDGGMSTNSGSGVCNAGGPARKPPSAWGTGSTSGGPVAGAGGSG
jgi:transposase, IS5 family